MRLRVFFYALAIAFFASCASPKNGSEGFVKVEDGQFVLNGRTINFVGTNFWYGNGHEFE